jgi:hypothetical protein
MVVPDREIEHLALVSSRDIGPMRSVRRLHDYDIGRHVPVQFHRDSNRRAPAIHYTGTYCKKRVNYRFQDVGLDCAPRILSSPGIKFAYYGSECDFKHV